MVAASSHAHIRQPGGTGPVNGNGSEGLVVLHVRHAPLVRGSATGTEEQRRATGGPHVLGAEIQLASPRQANADAQVDATPALTLAQHRTRYVRLEHVSDDRTTHGTML